MQRLTTENVDRMRAELDDDLNTAQTKTATFEMISTADTHFDTGQQRSQTGGERRYK